MLIYIYRKEENKYKYLINVNGLFIHTSIYLQIKELYGMDWKFTSFLPNKVARIGRIWLFLLRFWIFDFYDIFLSFFTIWKRSHIFFLYFLLFFGKNVKEVLEVFEKAKNVGMGLKLEICIKVCNLVIYHQWWIKVRKNGLKLAKTA